MEFMASSAFLLLLFAQILTHTLVSIARMPSDACRKEEIENHWAKSEMVGAVGVRFSAIDAAVQKVSPPHRHEASQVSVVYLITSLWSTPLFTVCFDWCCNKKKQKQKSTCVRSPYVLRTPVCFTVYTIDRLDIRWSRSPLLTLSILHLIFFLNFQFGGFTIVATVICLVAPVVCGRLMAIRFSFFFFCFNCVWGWKIRNHYSLAISLYVSSSSFSLSVSLSIFFSLIPPTTDRRGLLSVHF